MDVTIIFYHLDNFCKLFEATNFKKKSLIFASKKLVEQSKKFHQRKDLSTVFITRNGKQIQRSNINGTFYRASKRANLEKVTPHMLRVSWVTLVKQQGVPDSEIMKVAGHTSSQMIYAYDKTSLEDNYTKKLSLV